MRPDKGHRFDIVLMLTALLSAFLNIYGIWRDLYANAYYTAAVTSMLRSWHNFFFASLDPAGFITIDKPPVTFWIQTLFAYIFGVHGWSVILPQALAGVGSVLLVYKIIKPRFGITAARLAGLIMACSPIAVAVSRTNNIDSMLVFTLLLGTWMLFKGIRSQKPAWIIGAFAMIGAGFNIKMLQAYLILPAFYLFYLIAYQSRWAKKLGVMLAATVVLLTVSLSWAVIVDSIPQDNRPYIGGSKTNSVLELAFGYNGLQRLTGMLPRDRDGAGGPDSYRGDETQNQNDNPRRDYGYIQPNESPVADDYIPQSPAPGGDGNMMPGSGAPSGNPGSSTSPDGAPSGDDGAREAMPSQGGTAPSGGGMGGGSFGTGSAGPLRLFQSELSDQISWLLPFTGLACIALLAGIHRRKKLTAQQQESLFWLTWLLTGMVFFSVAGFFHHYYLIMLAPPIAVLSGAGWVEMYRRYRDNDGWGKWLLPAAIAVTTIFELYILKPYLGKIGAGWAVGIGLAGAGITLLLCLYRRRGRLASITAVAGMLVLLAAPLFWSATPIIYGDNSQLPKAGPGEQKDFGQRQAENVKNSGSADDALTEYLQQNNTGEKYFLMTTDASAAESYIISTGLTVVAVGGFSGSDPALTVEKLQEMAEKQEVKYFLLGSGNNTRDGGNNDVISWIKAHSTEIPREEWQGTDGSGSLTGRDGGKTLYKINQ